jgi:hypothetical protein
VLLSNIVTHHLQVGTVRLASKVCRIPYVRGWWQQQLSTIQYGGKTLKILHSTVTDEKTWKEFKLNLWGGGGKLRGLSQRANYTGRTAAACRRSYSQLLRIEGGTRPERWILRPYSQFLNRSRYFFFQVAPQLYSRGWVDPVPDLLLLRKSGSAGNLTRTSGSVGRNSDH